MVDDVDGSADDFGHLVAVLVGTQVDPSHDQMPAFRIHQPRWSQSKINVSFWCRLAVVTLVDIR